MAVTSARAIVGIKEKGHFEHEDARIEKYTLADELPEKLSELRLRPLSLDQRPLGLDQRPLGMDQRPLSKDKRPGYTVRRLGAQDKEQTLQFLRRFFFRDEPMNQAIQLLETPDSRCEELEEYAAATLDEEVSFAVVDDQGEFAGVIINGIVRREDALAAAAVDKSSDCPDPKFRRILSVLGHLERAARVWEQLAGAPVLEVRIASTHSAWRGRGLMRVLCEETERLAKQLGCGALRMDATSAFSAAAAERLGYRCVYRVKYTDLPEAPVPDPPHTEARVYLKEI